MLRMANPNSHQASSLIIPILCLAVFCTMVILIPHILGSMSEWLNNQAFEHHHLIEFEEEVFLLVFFASITIGVIVGQTPAMQQPIRSIYPSPQPPPPK
jgi:hypothetical protein